MHKRLISFCLIFTIAITAIPLPAMANEDSDFVLITEVQTGAASGGDEFIELYNPTNTDIDITGWQVRYANATATTDSTLIAEIGNADGAIVLPAHRFFVLHTSSISLESDVLSQIYPAKLSNADKSIGLFAPDAQSCRLEIIDAVAWGTAAKGEGDSLSALSGEKLLQRYQSTDNLYWDTDNNVFDWKISPTIKNNAVPAIATGATPGEDTQEYRDVVDEPVIGSGSAFMSVDIEDCEIPDDEETGVIPDNPLLPPINPPVTISPDDNETSGEAPSPIFPARNIGLRTPQLTELLPNPAKPQTDAADEFIELHNPNPVSFELSGFMLEVGKKRYVFPQGTLLEAQKFKAFFSSQTRLALSNTAGQVRFLDPFGRPLTQADPYQSAKDGQAWALGKDAWMWTTTPTPNAANTIKAPATKKKTTAKTASIKASTNGIATAKNSTDQAVNSSQTFTDDKPTNPLHPGVLALAAIFALLYGAYEYRRDVANKIYQLRAYREARREARQSLKGR